SAAPTALARRPARLPRTALMPRCFVDRRAVAERLPPVAVVPVPAHRFGDPLVPADLLRPAERPDLRGVEQVAPVVRGPVGADRLQRLVLAGLLEHRVRDLLDRPLDA